MGATFIYRLAPQTAFHFGRWGVGIEETAIYCPADTLFSALCLTMREWERDGSQTLERWLEQFPSQGRDGPPPLRLSSAFPYAGDVLFFAKPYLLANLSREVGLAQAKRLKKVAFVSEGIFRAWLSQTRLDHELRPGQMLHGGRVWVTGDELRKLEPFRDPGTGLIRLWATQTLPRVAVDRVTSSSSVYQAGVVRFRKGSGLFTLVEFLAADKGAAVDERDRLMTLFRVLGHSGLGGERSSGYGQFELQGPAPFAGFGDVAGDLFLTLSPYHPTRVEVRAGVLGEGAAYNLLTRRGWVGSPDGMNLRRRAVRMLGEGSVLRHVDRAGYGDLADVTPQDEGGNQALGHKVWRYGLAFPVPAVLPDAGKEVA